MKGICVRWQIRRQPSRISGSRHESSKQQRAPQQKGARTQDVCPARPRLQAIPSAHCPSSSPVLSTVMSGLEVASSCSPHSCLVTGLTAGLTASPHCCQPWLPGVLGLSPTSASVQAPAAAGFPSASLSASQTQPWSSPVPCCPLSHTSTSPRRTFSPDLDLLLTIVQDSARIPCPPGDLP